MRTSKCEYLWAAVQMYSGVGASGGMWVLSSQRAPSQGQVLEEGMEGGSLGKSSGPRMERPARPGEGQRAWPREALGTDLGLGRAGQLLAQLWRGRGGGLLE